MKEVEKLRAINKTEKAEHKAPDVIIEEVKEEVSMTNTQKPSTLRPQLLKKSAILQKPGLSPTKTVSNLHTATKPELLKLPEFERTKTDLKKNNTPRERMHGFTQEAYSYVKRNQILSTIVNIANFNLYNLRNSVTLHHIDEKMLRQVPQPKPKKELSHI